jgi:hypothetical protein
MAQRIETRMDRLEMGTKQGIRSGESTRPEAARPLARHARLNRKLRQNRRDGGGLRAAERAGTEPRQEAIRRDIYRWENDGQRQNP